MLTYIATENGSMEAEPGCHDDTVMALALVTLSMKVVSNQSR